jgi:ribulose-bisphosphate carboxylase small chain
MPKQATGLHTETFSYLPPLSREDTELQVRYILANGWIPGIEYTDRPDPADSYWQFWELPLFEATRAEEVLNALDECRAAHPGAFIRITGYDNIRQGQVLAFVAERPR